MVVLPCFTLYPRGNHRGPRRWHLQLMAFALRQALHDFADHRRRLGMQRRIFLRQKTVVSWGCHGDLMGITIY